MELRAIKLQLQYDGTRYHGWQIQPGCATVQQTVSDVLQGLLGHAITLHGSGRTDAGVHALGQVAHFHTPHAMPAARIAAALNSLLPPDIAVAQAGEVPRDFHARHSARRRTYWYLIWNNHMRSPFWGRYAWHLRHPLDIAAMRCAAAHLVGTHDFSTFQGADKKAVSPVRAVSRVRLRRLRQGMVVFEIQANAFLKHMVRSIVGTVAAVGMHTRTVEEFAVALHSRDRSRAGTTAPACGLILKEVLY